MSIVACRVCKKEVSKTAPTCPHCGESKPGEQKATVKDGLVGLAMVIAAVVGLSQCMGGDDKAAKVDQPPKLDDAACAKDLQCFGEKALIHNTAQCKQAVEKLAKHDVKWTDTLLDSKFSRYRWRNQDKRIATLIGDKAQFQNGFGAYTKIIYECDVQQTGDKWAVLGARVKEGSLAD
ncbi:zinc ribbon domain-containing protein [Limnohabitans sp. WS1]|uniref:zinc ribbon domain-containing protein n=1 Tax=Limnohabitans sp. WS1 TaxID=1100726 RepID=UPI0011B2335C|nr:zinc ribbon domain-containing protein [Limnohabitans sp. WS1]